MSSKNIVFVLGAGFSKAVCNEMPLANELIDRLAKRSEAISEKKRFLELLPDANKFELFLTHLAQEKPWTSEAQNSRDRADFLDLSRCIAHELQFITDKFLEEFKKEKVPVSWLKQLIDFWKQQKSNVISFNYDTLVEWTSIDKYVSGAETPYSGLSCCDSIYSVRLVDKRRSFDMISGSGVSHRENAFKLYKLHGSINWYYSGQRNFYGETIYVSPTGFHRDQEQGILNMMEDKIPLIMPPVLDKTIYAQNEQIKRLWYKAGEAIRSADIIVFIGYSFPHNDIHFLDFLIDNASCMKSLPEAWVVDVREDALKNYKNLEGRGFSKVVPFIHSETPIETKLLASL
ncbi:MAG: SIR2 family protein [Verrucomicrobiota bacterium]